MTTPDTLFAAPSNARRGEASWKCPCGGDNTREFEHEWRLYDGSVGRPLCWQCAEQHPEWLAIVKAINKLDPLLVPGQTCIIPQSWVVNTTCARQHDVGKYCGQPITPRAYQISVDIPTGGYPRGWCRCQACTDELYPRLAALLAGRPDPKPVVVAPPEPPKPTEAELLQAARARIHADLTRALSAVGRPQTATAIMAAIDAMIGAAK